MANRVAFYVNEAMEVDDPHIGRCYEIGRVTENEPGYYGAGKYGSLDVARETCRIRNVSNGLSEDDVAKIVSSSMAVSKIGTENEE